MLVRRSFAIFWTSKNEMDIVPAIDIIDGQCVRLTEGDYDTSKVYYRDPLTAARKFEDAGLSRLHVVDLDGARKRQVQNWDVLRSICTSTSLQVDFSGGISSEDDLDRAFDLGASQVAIGSLAAKQPERVMEWLNAYGAERIIVGADVRDRVIAVSGWQDSTGLGLFDFLERYTEAGAIHFLCTDIALDGRLEGPSTTLYREIMHAFPDIKLIASGGVSAMDDILELKPIGCSEVIVGKAIYEERITLQELKAYATT